MERKQKSGRKTPRSQPTRPGDRALIDDWLETKLRNAYSSVLDEPIPEELIELLNRKLGD